MSRNRRGWLLTGEYVHRLLLYMFVYASGELKKMQKCCNFVDNLQALISSCVIWGITVLWIFRMDARGGKDLCFLGIGVRIFSEMRGMPTFLLTRERSSKRHKLACLFRTCFWKRTAYITSGVARDKSDGFLRMLAFNACFSMGLPFWMVRF